MKFSATRVSIYGITKIEFTQKKLPCHKLIIFSSFSFQKTVVKPINELYKILSEHILYLYVAQFQYFRTHFMFETILQTKLMRQQLIQIKIEQCKINTMVALIKIQNMIYMNVSVY